ncbi:hypothetical protein KEN19_CDS0373 [Pseudomonas phage vB_PaePAO1-KEN19]
MCSDKFVKLIPSINNRQLHVAMQTRLYLHLWHYPVRCSPFRVT